MFQVSLTELMEVYVGVILALLFCYWFVEQRLRKRKERHSRKYHIQCNICGDLYRDTSQELLTRCPTCGSQNERDKVQHL